MISMLDRHVTAAPGREPDEILRGTLVKIYDRHDYWSMIRTFHTRTGLLQLAGQDEPIPVVVEGEWKAGDEITAVCRGALRAGIHCGMCKLADAYGAETSVLSLTGTRRNGDNDSDAAMKAAIREHRVPEAFHIADLQSEVLMASRHIWHYPLQA